MINMHKHTRTHTHTHKFKELIHTQTAQIKDPYFTGTEYKMTLTWINQMLMMPSTSRVHPEETDHLHVWKSVHLIASSVFRR